MKHTFTCSLLLVLFFLSKNVSAQTLKTVDKSQNAGKVEWLDRQISVGNVSFGQAVAREFRVKNISSENLIILQVKSTCACVVAEWQQGPIEPGQTGVIKITYDGQKEGDFYRIVSVSTNFDPVQTIPLALVGKVDKKPMANSGN